MGVLNEKRCKRIVPSTQGPVLSDEVTLEEITRINGTHNTFSYVTENVVNFERKSVSGRDFVAVDDSSRKLCEFYMLGTQLIRTNSNFQDHLDFIKTVDNFISQYTGGKKKSKRRKIKKGELTTPEVKKGGSEGSFGGKKLTIRRRNKISKKYMRFIQHLPKNE